MRGGSQEGAEDDIYNKVEWYAKPGQKNILLAYTIDPKAKIKKVRTFLRPEGNLNTMPPKELEFDLELDILEPLFEMSHQQEVEALCANILTH